MPETASEEMSTNECLLKFFIKCLAETYLEKRDVDEIQAKLSGYDLSFLVSNFHQSELPFAIDLISTMRHLIQSRPQTCANFRNFGGVEVLQKVAMVSTRIRHYLSSG